MKKPSAILLAAAMGLSPALCSCNEKEKNGGENQPDVGGWTTPESCAVTSDSKAALEKAT